MAKSVPGPERFVLSLALLVPLGIALVGIAQVPGVSLARPATLLTSDADTSLIRRPAASNPAPPPTLAAPTATPRPTATPVPPTPVVAPTAVVAQHRTYVVQRGDELKNIAAQYGVNIWKIIDANHIPNPDSLRVGQVLEIPDN